MKKSLIALGVIALMSGTAAKAADLVIYQDEPVTAPAQINWTGFYAGGTIGGSWSESKTRLRGAVKPGEEWGRLAKKTVNPDGFIGGLFGGYNFQMPMLPSFMKNVVWGVETDWVWNSGDDSGTKKDIYLSQAGGNYHTKVRQEWNGSTRLRAGYAMGSEGRFLPYIATGVSYANIQAKGSIRDNEGKTLIERENGQSKEHFDKTQSRAGWNIGGGVDYVPPIMNDHLIVRAEYRFTDYGEDTYKWKLGGEKVANQKVKFYSNDFRVGVAYKF